MFFLYFIFINKWTDAIIAIDETGTIISANKGACTLFEYNKNELIGNSINKLMPKHVASNHDNYLQQFVHSARQIKSILGKVRKLRGVKSSGASFPMELSRK